MLDKLIIGILYGVIGQILSFLQLQGSVKWNWFEKYPILVLLSAIPSTFFYIKSVDNLVKYANGELWPSRLIGFGVGIIIFTTLSWLMFNENISLKTFVCLMLAVCIICIQIFWK
jgi:multidrug transporter EmrE-like cation transporter